MSIPFVYNVIYKGSRQEKKIGGRMDNWNIERRCI
jgi:hypothetical protein